MSRRSEVDRVVGTGLLLVAAAAVWRGHPAQRGPAPHPGAAGAVPADAVAPPQGALAPLDRLQRRVGWLGFPLAVAKRFGEHGASRLAAVVSYYAFLSIFPLMLAFVTILGFVLEGDDELRARLLDSAVAQIPVVGTQIADAAGSLIEGDRRALASSQRAAVLDERVVAAR